MNIKPLLYDVISSPWDDIVYFTICTYLVILLECVFHEIQSTKTLEGQILTFKENQFILR